MKRIATIIELETGRHVHGYQLTDEVQLKDQTLYWKFETEKGEIWDCMDDYWELKEYDTRKYQKATYYFTQEKEQTFFNRLKNIFSCGVAK